MDQSFGKAFRVLPLPRNGKWMIKTPMVWETKGLQGSSFIDTLFAALS